jgi:hypothetical protein
LHLVLEGKLNFLREIFFNKLGYFNENLNLYSKPAIILGMFLLNRIDFNGIFNSVSFFYFKICKKLILEL